MNNKLFFCILALYSCNYVYGQNQAMVPSGPYLDVTNFANSRVLQPFSNTMWRQGGTPTLPISNASTTQSLFLRSSAGNGYQFEQPLSIGIQWAQLQAGINPHLIECQQPLGNPVCCAKNCQPSYLPAGTFIIPTSVQMNGCTGALSTLSPLGGFSMNYYPFAGSDYLNERGFLNSTLNNIYVDTIINNSGMVSGQYRPTTYGIATTGAPLFKNIGNGKSDPATLVGALQAGTFSILKNIFPNVAQTTTQFNEGSSQYTINFLPQTKSDNRYLIYPPSQHNPAQGTLAYKYHMGDPNLALSTDPVHGTQTIILYPTDVETSCQPVIYIGKDYSTGSLLALTYFIGNYALPDGTSCCQMTDSNGQPMNCPQDTLFLAPPPLGGTATAINPNNATKPLGGSAESPTLKPGRMRLIINNVSNFQIGYAAELDVLPGLYWPGQPDFTNPSLPAVIC